MSKKLFILISTILILTLTIHSAALCAPTKAPANSPVRGPVKIYSQGKYVIKKYRLPKNSGFKSYLRYWKIVNVSNQLTMQKYAKKNKLGFKKINNRYLIAIGTYFNAPVGTYVDLQLKNKKVIHCIVGDIKADKDTDKYNIFTKNGCCSEFIVDESRLPKKVRESGNVSYCYKKWRSPVACILVYNYNIFDHRSKK